MHICCVYVRQNIIDSGEYTHCKVRYDLLPMGISYISSNLQKYGYTTEMLYCTPFTYKNNIKKYIEKEPQIFAISVIADEDIELSIKLTEYIKKEYQNAKIIVGGPIVTIDTDKIYNNIKLADAICIGAGEKAVVEYAKQVEEGKYQKTDNLWIRDNDGQIIKCDKVVSIEDLDELPYPDRKGWRKWAINQKGQAVMITRGCIYNCIFCANGALKNRSDNRYYNERKVQNVIEEIEYIVEEYKELEYIELVGENALSNISKFREFCLAIKDKGFNKKIVFNTKINFTPNLLDKDEDILYLMKEANFRYVRFSMESGSIEIRKILKKPYFTNEQIIKFFNKLEEIDLKSVCFMMYCYPFETKESYKQTIGLLKQCRPFFISCRFLLSLKYTELFDMVSKTKYKKANFIDKYRFYTLYWRVYRTYKSKEFIFKTICLNNKYIEYIYNFFMRIKNERSNRNLQNLQKAKLYFDKKEYRNAIKYFDKIKIDKTNYWIYGDRAVAKMSIGDYKEALKDFDKVLKLEPNEVYKEKKKECLNKIIRNK